MNAITALYRTTIGKKIVMSVTGLLVVLWLLAHMSGNLLVFMGPGADYAVNFEGTIVKVTAMDAYAHFLKHGLDGLMGKLLWAARIGLLLIVVAHIWSAVQLYMLSAAARPEGYRVKRHKMATAASRTMIYGGVALGLYIVFHILHFTVGTVGFENSALPMTDATWSIHTVYDNVIASFANPLIVIIYVAAMVFLALHLMHGTWSLFQTLGINHERWDRLIRWLGRGIAAVLFFGFVSVPIAVMLGVVGHTGDDYVLRHHAGDNHSQPVHSTESETTDAPVLTIDSNE
jgi:succinate dehydrogenase / fumarate reductase cytochrome b subunit